MEKDILSAIYDSDPFHQKTKRRFSTGRVLAVKGRSVEVDVGAILPDGSTQTMVIPCAAGFSPTVGQAVSINYANDNLNAPYAIAVGDAAGVDPLLTNRTELVLPFDLYHVAENVLMTTKQAALLLKTAGPLYLTGVTIFASSVAGAPEVDIYMDSSSVLAVPQTVSSATVHEPTLAQSWLNVASEISIRCATDAGESLNKLAVRLWCTAALP